MYKYDCRKCPIRNRCIEESNNAPSVKGMVRHAFSARTDTVATWALLQINCLLVKADEERARRNSQEGTSLSRRLREIREAREGTTPPSLPEKPVQRPDYLQPVSPHNSDWMGPPAEEKQSNITAKSESRWEISSLGHLPPDTPTRATSASSETRPDMIGAVETPLKVPSNKQKAAANQPRPHWLTISTSNRHIALPASGELVLGRFDPKPGSPAGY